MPKFFTKAKPKTTVIAGINDTLTSKIGFCYVKPLNELGWTYSTFDLNFSSKVVFSVLLIHYILGKDVQYEFFCNKHQQQGDKKEKTYDQKM